MAANLTALVQNLRRLSTTATSSSSYEQALLSYFTHYTATTSNGMLAANKVDTVLEKVSQALTDDPDGPQRFAAYRLWIEVLAARSEHKALQELKEHLRLRGQADPDDHETYMALRGLVHYELDQLEAARLFAESMADYWHNPYALELVQLVAQRPNKQTDANTKDGVPALLRSTVAVQDYFHWQTIVRSLLPIHGEKRSKDPHQEAREEALAHVRAQFRTASLPHLAEFHTCIDARLYAAAAMVAARLVELQPNQIDFRYNLAFAHYENGDYPAARRVLEESLYLTPESDAEFLSLLGHCYAKMGEASKAKTYLQRAIALLASEGLPSTHVRLELNEVEEELRGDAVDPVMEIPREPRHWIVTLSPRRYHEMQTSPENLVDRLLRPMGKDPRPGDYCFFAYPDETQLKHQTEWKIAAVYVVDSEPVWHPVYRYQTALKLVNRPDVAIPIDVEMQEDDMRAAAQGLPKDHPFHYGVFEFGAGALDIINEAIKRYKNGEIERRADGGKSRRPTA